MSDLSDFKRRVYEPEVAALKQQVANRSAIIVRLERVIDTLQAQSAAATSQIAAASDSRARLHDRFEAAEERIATLERERNEAREESADARASAEAARAMRDRHEERYEKHKARADRYEKTLEALLVDVERIAADDASVLWKQDRDTVYEAWHALRKQAEAAVNKARAALAGEDA